MRRLMQMKYVCVSVCVCVCVCMPVQSLQSCPTLCNTVDCSPSCSSVHGDSPGKKTGAGCHALLQGFFWAQEWIPYLLHLQLRRWTLNCWATRKTLCIHMYIYIYFIDVWLIYNVVLISIRQQSDSVIYVHTYIYILFHMFSYYDLSQDVEYSSLCYTGGSCCVSILYIIVCIC